ncbi:MAG: class II fructose-bisphosphatase [Firmicutes bacterium]|nr:class II fructose-bisphosphatase [Bacillota bacterium]
MERELALEFVRVTEAAALAAARWVGSGDKIAADNAATEAMRAMLDSVRIRGRVVIGEGEMDEAPMLYIGETVGDGSGPEVDIGVDPLEGTNLVAKGLPDALTVLCAAPKGQLLHAPDMYMQKIAVGPTGRGVVHLDAPIEENLQALSVAKGKPISQLTVVMLDRPRHEQLLASVRRRGARAWLIPDGDVAAAIATCLNETGIDMLVGSGGAPEGVLAAAAIRALGGDMQAQLLPEDDAQRQRCLAMGLSDPAQLLTLDDLVGTQDVIFAATGVTNGYLLRGVNFMGDGIATTHSLVTRAESGTVRQILARHELSKKPHLVML